jgi:hypothetical protein
VALIQHPLIGDYLTGGVQLLWSISMSMYGIGSGLESLSNIALELVLFVVSVTVLFKTKDVFSLFKPHPLNIILSIPLIAVLLPTVISYPLSVPLVMPIPHLFYFVLFSFSILTNLKSILTKN